MTTTTSPTGPDPAATRRRYLGWLGGVGLVGFLGVAATPLGDLTRDLTAPAPAADGLAGQRLVYAHVEAGEYDVGGHVHDATLFVRAADFERPGALGAVLAYPERAVNRRPFGVLVHRLQPADHTTLAGPLAAYGAACTGCGTLLRFHRGGGPDGQDVDECPLDGCQFDPARGGRPVAGRATAALPRVDVSPDAVGVLTLAGGWLR